MKRLFDICLSLLALIVLSPVLVGVAISVGLTSPGPILYWSNRVGHLNISFRMPKFRTMHVGAPEVASHLLEEPTSFITGIGKFLRKTSLDEIPQFWNILSGDMSLVGPRPALFNQTDLIAMRTEKGLHLLIPGLTGWAQVNGRDDLPMSRKVELDLEYAQRKSLFFDIKILYLTIGNVFYGDSISH